jgi:hypothetical protein
MLRAYKSTTPSPGLVHRTVVIWVSLTIGLCCCIEGEKVWVCGKLWNHEDSDIDVWFTEGDRAAYHLV